MSTRMNKNRVSTTQTTFSVGDLFVETIPNNAGETEVVCFKTGNSCLVHMTVDECYALISWLEKELPYEE